MSDLPKACEHSACPEDYCEERRQRDPIRKLVADGVASGELGPGALERYDAVVAYHVELARRELSLKRSLPLQPCEAGK